MNGMFKNIEDLFSETDRWTGENIFYEDAQLKKAYNGVVVDYFKGVLSWEFEVKDGYKTGIEKIYYDTGELMEENDTDHNTVNGIAKEYYKSGKLKSASIVLHNAYIDSIVFDESGNVVEKTSMDGNETGFYLKKEQMEEYRKKYMPILLDIEKMQFPNR